MRVHDNYTLSFTKIESKNTLLMPQTQNVKQPQIMTRNYDKERFGEGRCYRRFGAEPRIVTNSLSSSSASWRKVVAVVTSPSLSSVQILSNPALLPSVLGLRLPIPPSSRSISSSAGDKSCISQLSSSSSK